MKISDILTGPEKWCKGFAAINESGQPCNADDQHAFSFCLLGAVCRAYPPEIRHVARQKIFAILERTQHNIADFNDDPETTFEMVLEVVRKAGV